MPCFFERRRNELRETHNTSSDVNLLRQREKDTCSYSVTPKHPRLHPSVSISTLANNFLPMLSVHSQTLLPRGQTAPSSQSHVIESCLKPYTFASSFLRFSPCSAFKPSHTFLCCCLSGTCLHLSTLPQYSWFNPQSQAQMGSSVGGQLRVV